MKLYEILEERRAVLANEDASSDEVKSYLDALDIAIEDKVADCVAVADELERESHIATNASMEIRRRGDAKSRRADRLRRYAMSAMQAAGIAKVKHPIFPIAIVDNPPYACIPDDDALIKHCLENGEQSLLRPPEPGEWEVDRNAVLRRLRDQPGSIPDHLASLGRTQRLQVR